MEYIIVASIFLAGGLHAFAFFMVLLRVFKLNTTNRFFSDGNLDDLSKLNYTTVIFTLMVLILLFRSGLERPELIYAASASFVLLGMTLVAMLGYIIGKPQRSEHGLADELNR